MLGFYENFPVNIHRIEAFTASMSNKSLQRRLIQVLRDVNCRKFSFEEVSCPTVPECTIIFEAGLADAGSFNYTIDQRHVFYPGPIPPGDHVVVVTGEGHRLTTAFQVHPPLSDGPSPAP